MKTYVVGGTVVIYVETRRKVSGTWTLYTPVPDSGNAVEFTLAKEDGTSVVTATALAEEDTGKFSYNIDTAGYAAGKYRVRIRTCNGDEVSYKDGVFKLEA